MMIIDYASLTPGSKRTTAEDRERAKNVAAELSTIAKNHNLVIVTVKAPVEIGDTNDRS